MKKILVITALLISTTVYAKNVETPRVYREVAAAPTNSREAEVAALFDRWNAALATGNADQVTKLYAADAVLEPTVSNEVRTTPAEIKSYFVKFLQMKPQGTINYRQIRFLGDNAALDTGVYTFNLTKDGKAKKVHARYTYVYKKVDSDWKILNHHSSMMPELAND
ncbi:hypothetical protein CFter6_0565 [Collimonas fungivorans]|uniref:Calcium/calmodulin-dependent protein kinase II association-domain domain-containing protein n=1 Tax=Collimonas fungivorans TaxID=158899 RepID=A0A127P6J7_9BURK|nr:SgcJ/EcaC family oxidoreductase [Collimonas fungivorans]AMO93294.1 hypothetical protein CFter6_0565 [Collimonas fungivorans]